MRRILMTVVGSSVNIGGNVYPKSTTPYAVTVSELDYRSLQGFASAGHVIIAANNNPETSTIIEATTGTASGEFDVENANTATIHVCGTASSISVSFFGSVDNGTNWFPISGVGYHQDFGTYQVTSTEIGKAFRFFTEGVDKLKCSITSIAGGNAYVIGSKVPVFAADDR